LAESKKSSIPSEKNKKNLRFIFRFFIFF
jgi:hypothetical protein